jgi:CHAT domain-containing protein
LLIDGLRRQNDLVRAEQARAGDPAIARLRKVRGQLALWASTREARAYDEWKKKHDALAAEKEALERTVLASAPANVARISLQALQTALRESEALIDIYKFDQFDRTSTWQSAYAAIITGRTAPPRLVRIGPARQVETLVAQWLDGIAADRSEAAWAALTKAVWAPLVRALPEGTRVARVSGDADLVRLPWHAFAPRGAATAALDVVEVSSARSLVNARSQSRPPDRRDRVLIVGGVDYDAGRTPRTPGYPNTPFPRLRWTADESQQIESLARDNGLDPEWLKEAAATRTAVLQRMSVGSYVHFATHGFVPDESTDGSARTPLVDSGIALSGANVRDPVTLQNGGLLTAEEILDTDLSSARLVVLSACKTALGVKASGQGLLGLRSSLHAAGAHRIVMSLWAVDDEATQLLMSAFYRNLWIKKIPLLAAFHAAQDSVRQDERFRAPRFWAGWSIVDPD